MPAIPDAPDLVTFDRDEFARAWHDASAPRRMRVTPETQILVRRCSANDVQDRQIYLWIDDEPLSKIRYGEAISRPIEPASIASVFSRATRH